MKWIKRCLLCLSLLYTLNAVAQKTTRVIYKQVDTTRLFMDVYYPDGYRQDTVYPAMVFFFGGGWNSGSIQQFRPQAEHFAKRGMVCFLVDYRVMKRHGTTPFEALADARSAIRYIRSHAPDFRIHPDKIVGAGGSAGGHLAAATALVEDYDDPSDDTSVSCKPNALVLFNPVIDNGPGGYGHERIGDAYTKFSPMHVIASGAPPTLVLLGTQDHLIPLSTGHRFQERMEAVGSRCDLKLYEGGKHGFFNFNNKQKYYMETLRDADSFLVSLGLLRPWVESRPNIVFIAIDDMNDWTGFLGGHEQALTPNIDKLASKGINFANAHCAAPACSPSRNSLLLGVQPFRSGLYPFYDRYSRIDSAVRGRYTSLPALLKANGYNTYASGKIHHGNDTYKVNQGCEEWSAHNQGLLDSLPDLVYDATAGYMIGSNRKMAFCPFTSPEAHDRDYQTALYGVKQLEEQHEKPFFLALGFTKPHLPFVAPKEYFDLYPDSILEPPIKEDDLADVPWAGRSNVSLKDEVQFRRDGAWTKVRRAYLACISYTDANIGKVLNALETSPYKDNTIVVLWSDHGYHLGEKRSFRKFSLWEEATRSPLIICDLRPEYRQSGVCAEAVSLTDLYKTVAELTATSFPEYADGVSLVPWLRDPALAREVPAIVTWGRGNYAVRTKDWRYIRYFDKTEELYDHRNDPNEWNNLAGDPLSQEKRKELAAWLPENEAPLVKTAVTLHNVVDADKPELGSAKDRWKRLGNGLQPPLDKRMLR